MRRSSAAAIVGTFPVLVVLQSALFYSLPFLVPLLSGAALAVYGIALLIASGWQSIVRRNKRAVPALTVVIATGLCWAFIPTKEFAVHVRFWLEQEAYERAVAETAGGAQPRCLLARECMSDGYTPPYLVFPFPGILSGWVGIVHVPEPDQAPTLARLKAIAAEAGCEPGPIAPHYYVCGFY
jgi:hypothetical protein